MLSHLAKRFFEKVFFTRLQEFGAVVLKAGIIIHC